MSSFVRYCSGVSWSWSRRIISRSFGCLRRLVFANSLSLRMSTSLSLIRILLQWFLW